MNNKYFLIVFCIFQIGYANEADISQLSDKSGTGSMTEIQKKNVFGHEQYSLAAVQLAKNSMMQFVHGSECQNSCPVGCCDSGDGLMYEASMFSMLNHAANTQAAQHRFSAMQACQTFNKLSSAQKNCVAEISPLTQFVPHASWYDDKGKCTSSAPKECLIMEGLSVSPYQNINKGCDSSGAQNCTKKFFNDFKLNADGSMMMKTSTGTKKLTLNDFADPQKLAKMGLSLEKAKELSQKFSQNSSNFKIKNLNQGFSDMKNSLSIAESEKVQPSEESLDSSDSTLMVHQQRLKLQDATRLPSASEVYRKLDGDPLGRSQDDIFSMIQKRYQENDQSNLFNE
jgi:hypothetical protein